jgi:hypothetical protein
MKDGCFQKSDATQSAVSADHVPRHQCITTVVNLRDRLMRQWMGMMALFVPPSVQVRDREVAVPTCRMQ